MTVSLQVAYPTTEGTKFDMDYYTGEHFKLVDTHMGPHIATSLVTRGLSGPAGAPMPFYAVATFTFADQEALNAAMAAAGPVIADIPNFTDTTPMILVGDVLPA